MPGGSSCSSTAKTLESGSGIERPQGEAGDQGATKQHRSHLSPFAPTDKNKPLALVVTLAGKKENSSTGQKQLSVPSQIMPSPCATACLEL